MNVILTSEYAELVQKKVEAGRFKSASDVVAEALRLMEMNDQFSAFQKYRISQEIDEALESLERGEGVDGDEVFDCFEVELDASERES